MLPISLVAVVVLWATGTVAWSRAEWPQRSSLLWALVALEAILMSGLALTWTEVREAPVRAKWLEPMALVLSLAVGIALGSALEQYMVDGALTFGGWSLIAVGLAAAVLLSRMRLSHWFLGARLGPIIPLRMGPEGFRPRWQVSDPVIAAYAQEMLPKNAILGPVENTYPDGAAPTIAQCAEAVTDPFREALAAGRVIMPGSERYFIAPSGRNEELIVVGGLFGQRLQGSTVLVDNEGPTDGAFVRLPVEVLQDDSSTETAEDYQQCEACRLIAIRFDGSRRPSAHRDWCEVSQSWLKPDAARMKLQLGKAAASVDQYAARREACSPAVATNGKDTFAFALGAVLGQRYDRVGSARWVPAASSYEPVSFPAVPDQQRASSPVGKSERYQWFARLITGTFLRTIALLLFGAMLALAMEWAILGSETDPPWLWLATALIVAVVALLLAIVFDSGITSPRFQLALAGQGLKDSVGWWSRTIVQTTSRGGDSSEAQGKSDAEWVKRRLVDIYSAFPATDKVSVVLPDKTADDARWTKFGEELKSGFRGPQPIRVSVSGGTQQVTIHPRSQAQVVEECESLPGDADQLKAIVVGTGPKQGGRR